MQHMVLSTDDVPEADRFSYWRETVGEGLLGTSAERNKRQETAFNARADVSIGASFARFRFRTDGYPVFRRRRPSAVNRPASGKQSRRPSRSGGQALRHSRL